jgi:uncharacterized protein YcbK (DUF882 family)
MPHAPFAAARRLAGRLVARLIGPSVALAVVLVLGGVEPAAAMDRPRDRAARRPAKAATRSAKSATRSAKRTDRRAAARAETRAATRTGARTGTRAAGRAVAARAARAERRAHEAREARVARAERREREEREERQAAARRAETRAARAVAAASRLVIPAVALAPERAAAPVPAPAAAPPDGRHALDTLAGRSGKLRARWGLPSTAGLFTYLRRLFGDSAAAPGVDPVGAGTTVADGPARPFRYIAMLPFAEKVDGRIGAYRMGFWPGERQLAAGTGRDAPPAGFIRVTADNAGTPVSEHFRLRDFLTHDQTRVWPKYLALDAGLVDKLELVLDDLRARGYRADRLHVMSGFRTPQYNRGGGDPSGRAERSRHQYGDAADVWVENGDGTMADLTGDGRVDVRDAAVLAESAARVEARHPALVGGVGVYHGTRAHGPFVHIDTRGHRARWGAG